MRLVHLDGAEGLVLAGLVLGHGRVVAGVAGARVAEAQRDEAAVHVVVGEEAVGGGQRLVVLVPGHAREGVAFEFAEQVGGGA